MRTEIRRALLATTAGLTLAVGAIGLAHAPFARPLLLSLGGCPMAGARMTPRESETARFMALGEARGEGPAPARPALGFALDSTTAADVHAWAHGARVDCDDVRVGLVRCAHVPPAALGLPARDGAIDELSLEFDEHAHLVNMTTLRAHLSAGDAANAANAIISTLADRLGPAGKKSGDFDAARLGAPGAYSISTVAYR
jgi:hypothetical protein